MKKFYYLLASIAIVFVTIIACEEASIEMEEIKAVQDEGLLAKTDKIDVCHYDTEYDTWHLINVSIKSLDMHVAKHGDVYYGQDDDGDGYPKMSECGELGNPRNDGLWDCDDNDADVNPEAPEICGDGIDNNCDGQIDECTYVPDDNFEGALIFYGLDDELDNFVLTENINKITVLYIFGKSISDLTGIEDFTSLQTLQCHKNSLENIDISKNINLTDFTCHYNLLETLDVSKNVKLTRLLCNDNLLENIDVTTNIELTNLGCYNNKLTSLDVNKNINLTNLGCTNNKLTSLDVSKNINLERLYCYTNQLTSLDVSKNINLERLYCYTNLLTTLDVSANKHLWTLECYDNPLTETATNKILADLVLNGVNDGELKFLNNATGQGILDRATLEASPRNWDITNMP